eukprot:NODE_7282_length_778_cov_6.047328_g7041_i0.p1 GENE.NODE_7282_length_778_cov_6.047328_g7041_i0~~NODE_7282_length_778_cov_6.047328_g7041_i0.p1  ORF type:complete len:212 (-),score=25.71 NODE_7282_length_778_cov_6.047328_g7041_i0:106-741(-)
MAETKQGGSIRCRCGKSVLFLANRKIRCQGECACADCRQKQEWAIAHATDEITMPIITTGWYVESDIMSVEGLENMKSYRLREDGQSTFCVATCCSSVMGVSAPFYANNTFLMFPAQVKPDLDTPPPSMGRFNMKECEDPSILPPFEGLVLYNDDRDDPAVMSELVKGWATTMCGPVADRKGDSLDDVIARIGTTTVLNLKPGEHIKRSDV